MFQQSIWFSLRAPLFLLIICFQSHATTIDKNLWISWSVHTPNNVNKIDHTSWQNFIKKYVTKSVDGLSLVRYARVTPQDHKSLKQYLQSLSKIKINLYDRKQQLAYWLNLYNALIVNLVISHYPISTIQQINISPGLFSKGPWDAKLIKVNNIHLTLNDIRNRIIRPIWNDPRALFALCNSAIGSPNIYKEAFDGSQITEQLNDAAVNYINALRGVQITQGKLIVSQLFEWYEEDFGGTKQEALKYIRVYATDTLKEKLKTFKTINSYAYNWHLNSQIVDE